MRKELVQILCTTANRKTLQPISHRLPRAKEEDEEGGEERYLEHRGVRRFHRRACYEQQALPLPGAHASKFALRMRRRTTRNLVAKLGLRI